MNDTIKAHINFVEVKGLMYVDAAEFAEYLRRLGHDELADELLAKAEVVRRALHS